MIVSFLCGIEKKCLPEMEFLIFIIILNTPLTIRVAFTLAQAACLADTTIF